MNIRRFRALHEAGASYVEIAAEVGCDWRTVRKYLADELGEASPPQGSSRAGTQPRVIAPYVARVEAWLRADIDLRGSVIHERLVADYGFTGSYQRVKMFLAEARPRIAAELDDAEENPLRGLHRRFDVVPGAQAQVDWGDEAHRPLPADSELAQAIAVLARAQQDAVWERTCAHNKLRSVLREYYPGLLATFANKRDGLLRPKRARCSGPHRRQGRERR